MTRTKYWLFLALGTTLMVLLIAGVANVPQALADRPTGGSGSYHPGYGMGPGMMGYGSGMGQGMMGHGYSMGWNNGYGMNNRQWGQMPGSSYQRLPDSGNSFQSRPQFDYENQQRPQFNYGYGQMPGYEPGNWWNSPMNRYGPGTGYSHMGGRW